MKIHIPKLIPSNWIVKPKGDFMEVYYHNKRPQNDPKKHLLIKRCMDLDKTFYEGLGLYLGDSDMNRKEKGHLSFTSRDKDIALHALDFLRNYFNTKVKDVTFLVQYNKLNKNLQQDWANYLSVPQNKILTRYSPRYRHEAIQIQVNGAVFRKTFELIVKEALSRNFIQNKELRTALLRGLFAAEGCVGIEYSEKKPYINEISFNLNINESFLINLISEILKKEGITHKLKPRPKTNHFQITISNWQNYWELYKISLFDICQRKKDNFTKIMENLKIFVILKTETNTLLFNSLKISQKEIARLIGSYQGNVSKLKKGELNLTAKQLETLRRKAKIPKKRIISNVIFIRIGHATYIKDPLFKHYIFSQ